MKKIRYEMKYNENMLLLYIILSKKNYLETQSDTK